MKLVTFSLLALVSISNASAKITNIFCSSYKDVLVIATLDSEDREKNSFTGNAYGEELSSRIYQFETDPAEMVKDDGNAFEIFTIDAESRPLAILEIKTLSPSTTAADGIGRLTVYRGNNPTVIDELECLIK